MTRRRRSKPPSVERTSVLPAGVPRRLLRLGSAIAHAEEPKHLHDSRFEIDEVALPIGTELMVQIAVDALYRLEE